MQILLVHVSMQTDAARRMQIVQLAYCPLPRAKVSLCERGDGRGTLVGGRGTLTEGRGTLTEGRGT